MCSYDQFPPHTSPWRDSLNAFIWRHRDDIRGVIAVGAALAALAGVLVYLLRPTDIERAEADLVKARAIVCALDREAETEQEATVKHRKRAAEYRQLADENKDTTDLAWLERCRAIADGNLQVSRAKHDRRDNLTHLAAVYLRLLAEAESEILRAKDARDRGTPYKVTPRVREILGPILSER